MSFIIDAVFTTNIIIVTTSYHGAGAENQNWFLRVAMSSTAKATCIN